jgi:hypothetical protein
MSPNADRLVEEELLRMIEADPLPFLLDVIDMIKRVAATIDDPAEFRRIVSQLVDNPRTNSAILAAQKMVDAKRGWGPTIGQS